jgi:predicted Zn finger-like uncharacterized protein
MMTLILLTCDHCFANLKVQGALAGKHVRCPECNARIEVPVIFKATLPAIAPLKHHEHSPEKKVESIISVARSPRIQSSSGGLLEWRC